MGVLPLQFKDGASRQSLGLTGEEIFDISGIADGITPGMDVACRIRRPDGSSQEIALLCRIDTADEVEYYRNGGILQYVLRNLMKAA
jgi:aconitate hydratase